MAEAAGIEPAHAARGDLANRCHTVRRRLQVVNWRKGQDLNLQATSAVVFKTTALPVRLPFQTFSIADWRLPIDYFKRRKRPIKNRQLAIENDLVHVVGTYEVVGRLIYSQVLLLLSHTCEIDLRSQISQLRFQIPDRFVLKNR